MAGEGSALTVTELRAALDAYLDQLLRHHDRNLVRFKIVLTETEQTA